ncbi:unnamed protein product [Phaedon cochleariae]|uniref:Peptidase S1 domain-containing protein n=1 Tax=Phaedon cochleariae TaxID=80249 RepID=A0A9P0DE97_PHACE|nr:unnamed protein product [Phaedon cochleariae]
MNIISYDLYSCDIPFRIKMITVTLSIVLSLIFSITSATRLGIVNGEVADIRDFPYMVAFLDVFSDYYREVECGASILDEKTLLTAGHCVLDGINLEWMRIGIGHTNVSQATLVKVANVYQHEEFIFAPPFKNDIGIIKLVDPLPLDASIQPLQLPQKGEATPKGKSAVVAGWGRDQNEEEQQLLHKIDVVVYNDDDCERIWANVTDETYPEYSYASNRTIQICAKYPQTIQAGVCHGDSGSPLVVDGVQYGVVSYMQLPCGNKDYPVVFTKVSAYLDWIVSKMG